MSAEEIKITDTENVSENNNAFDSETIERAKNCHVSIQHIDKVYSKSEKAVWGFDLDIALGEFIVIVGPSGCGKSTTLRMIAGFEEITDGDIYIDGELVNYKSPKDRKMAMVFQSYALYPQMTVFDNIAFPLRINKFNGVKLTKEEIERRVFKAAEILNLGEYLDRFPSQLSGGQMQRVALGRAIVKEVSLFLMDEPLSNLDAKLRMSMRSEIVKLQQRLKATVIYVTHDQTEAMTMATKVVVMSKGFVQQIDTPEKCYSEPNNMFVANFIGAPSINFIDAVYSDGKLRLDNSISVDFGTRFVEAHDKYYLELSKSIDAHFNDLNAGALTGVDEFIRRAKASKLDAATVKAEPKKKGRILDFFKNFKNIKFGKKKQEEKLAEFKMQLNSDLSALKQSVENCLSGEHQMILAIRPERIKLTKEMPRESKNALVFKTTVDICELLGADYYISFNILGKTLTSKCDVETHFAMNDEIYVILKSDDFLIFDSVTGERVRI